MTDQVNDQVKDLYLSALRENDKLKAKLVELQAENAKLKKANDFFARFFVDSIK